MNVILILSYYIDDIFSHADLADADYDVRVLLNRYYDVITMLDW